MPIIIKEYLKKNSMKLKGDDTMLIHTEEIGTITIATYVTDESYYQYHGNVGDNEIEEKIESGQLECFEVKVSACIDDIEIASEYLGCCVYENYIDFVTANDYYSDMKKDVLLKCKTLADQLLISIKEL